MTEFVVAAANWRLRPQKNLSGLAEHVHDLCLSAKKGSAELLLLPEYALLESFGFLPRCSSQEVPRLLLPLTDEYIEHLQLLSRRHSLIIVGGSCFQKAGAGIANSAPTVYPDGRVQWTGKQQLIPFESGTWGLTPVLKPDRLISREIAVAICYDSEFPEIVRESAVAGAKIVLVPAQVESMFGFNRVHISCRARAIENQIFVVQANICGEIEGGALSGVGCASIFSPIAPGFPEDGVLASTRWNEEGVAIAKLDFDTLDDLRNYGEVRNFQDFLGIKDRELNQ